MKSTATMPTQNRSSKEVSVEEGARILGIRRDAMLNLVDRRQVKARKSETSRQTVVDYDSLIEFFNASAKRTVGQGSQG